MGEGISFVEAKERGVGEGMMAFLGGREAG